MPLIEQKILEVAIQERTQNFFSLPRLLLYTEYIVPILNTKYVEPRTPRTFELDRHSLDAQRSVDRRPNPLTYSCLYLFVTPPTRHNSKIESSPMTDRSSSLVHL